VDVLQPAPADPFAKPVFPTAAIRDLVLKAGSSHRMQIRGVVTCKREGFYVVQDRTGGLLVRPVTNGSVKTGELVDVVGFPVASASGVMLTEALSRRAGQAVMPQPVVLPANTTFSGAWNQKLVQIEAVLLEQHVANDVQYLDLQAGQRVFRATLPLAGGRLDAVAPGSLVRVAGIARIEAADLSAGLLDATGKPFVASLELLLRNANDLSVIKRPPWWNWKYTAGTIALFCVALTMSFLWIKTLRRRVEERTHALRETMGKLQKETRISATLAERDRLAGEIHDSVEQGLSAIMLQLDAAKQFVNQPEEVDRFLTLAKNMAGFSRTEVHHVVWGMQSPLLENADLPAALRRVAREISVGDTPLVTVEVSGPVRPLPSSIEHHLLRIGQEAITNAVKHARPKIIRLRLGYEPDGIALAIEDDGCGFDPDVVPPGNGHFGLQGIRNRGRKMNARLEIGSQPGRGTRIVVTIPLRPAATTIDS
jgi:signal transduction histidine kinase